MQDRTLPPILSAGTTVVLRLPLTPVGGGDKVPAGSVGTIVRSPLDATHTYRVKLVDGGEVTVRRDGIEVLRHFHAPGAADMPGGDGAQSVPETLLREHVIYRCIVGSRAYGLDRDGSDTDRRGAYLPPAELQWSLFGVPEQIENHATEECYWELGKLVLLALKANPNVLEVLWTPLVEHTTPVADELLAMRGAFLSKLVYVTYNGYVLSQFRKIETDLRLHTAVKPKHAMHLVRLLLSGITAVREGHVPVRVEEHRDRLLAIRDGTMPWPEVDAWRRELHREFDAAFAATKLPERPDYEAADRFLVRARRQASEGPKGTVPRNSETPRDPPCLPPLRDRGVCEFVRTVPGLVHGRGDPVFEFLGTVPAVAADPRVRAAADAIPHRVVFATISGAHLYGFASPDSDFDVRACHVLPPEDVVGLRAPVETITVERKDSVDDGVAPDGGVFDLDLVSHDLRKFAKMLLQKNGYVLEQLTSPLVVRTSPLHDELRALAPRCITRHHMHHYLGFVATEWKLFVKATPRRVKPLLYVYRVLLTGIHLMRTGEIEANLVRLHAQYGDEFGLSWIPDLVARKTTGAEKGALADADVAFHDAQRLRLEEALRAASAASALPEVPSAGDALHDLVVRARLGR